jgi:hypothetical protein
MQRMLYKKTPVSDPEVVWMLSAYKDHDGKFKAIIMRDYFISKAIEDCPYVEVKLNKLRPFKEDYNKLFCKV